VDVCVSCGQYERLTYGVAFLCLRLYRHLRTHYAFALSFRPSICVSRTQILSTIFSRPVKNKRKSFCQKCRPNFPHFYFSLKKKKAQKGEGSEATNGGTLARKWARKLRYAYGVIEETDDNLRLSWRKFHHHLDDSVAEVKDELSEFWRSTSHRSSK